VGFFVGGARSNPNQARNANGNAGLLQSFDAILNLPVGHRHPGSQPDYSAQDRMMKRSTKASVLAKVAEHQPSRSPRCGGASARPFCDRAHELLEVFEIDPVFELDSTPDVVGQGLHGDRHVRQLHPRSHVGLVSQLQARRAGSARQQDHHDRRRRERNARIGQ